VADNRFARLWRPWSIPSQVMALVVNGARACGGGGRDAVQAGADATPFYGEPCQIVTAPAVGQDLIV